MRSLALFVGAVLLAAAGYELALALGVSHVGRQPGEGVAGAGTVEAIALLAMLLGIVVGLVCVLRPQRAAGLLAPAAGLFVTAMEYTYDPYYAPAQRRFADGGTVPTWLVFALLAASPFVGAFTWRWPRLGGPLTSLALFVWGVAALFVSEGR